MEGKPEVGQTDQLLAISTGKKLVIAHLCTGLEATPTEGLKEKSVGYADGIPWMQTFYKPRCCNKSCKIRVL